MGDALKPGDPAPNFDLPTAGGGRVSLKKLRGRPAIVYFYPKDDTPGCTQEALDFTEKAAEFEALGAAVLGVSKDDAVSHHKFQAKYRLKVALASDPDLEAAKAFGVWVEKNLYGRKSMGVERATFLIDAKGRISRIWRRVKVKGHVDEVLAAARDLAS
ncbi:MAG: peroxiredoxin [Hydrogenophilaceae bacterium]|jgi:peroxiredoxin Q/BCP|nr:peroxiredoxin [Hydrogenophilaceae bacterium]